MQRPRSQEGSPFLCRVQEEGEEDLGVLGWEQGRGMCQPRAGEGRGRGGAHTRQAELQMLGRHSSPSLPVRIS